MRTEFLAVLDACVLLPMPLADTLLRFAEHPSLYLPQWSDQIMGEVTRNLVEKWRVSPAQAAHREAELRRHFPEAWVEGYEGLIPVMTNDPKDRHVLAAAVRCGASVLVTYNAKDFPRSALEPWGIERQGPSTFLRNLYDLDPALAVHKLHQQASQLSLTIEELLARLRPRVPGFVEHFCVEREIQLPCP